MSDESGKSEAIVWLIVLLALALLGGWYVIWGWPIDREYAKHIDDTFIVTYPKDQVAICTIPCKTGTCSVICMRSNH